MFRIRLSRRGVLCLALSSGALAGATALTGCDLDPGSSSAPAPTPRADPDHRIVDAALTELADLVSRLRATGGTAGLVACHRTQLAALGGGAPPATRRRAPLTTAEVVARERRAADRFASWASTCADGDLARVLASIAAGIRMQPIARKVPS